MKRFVVVGHRAASSGDFKLDDMAGGAGRLDILLRCINSTFFLSHGIRRDAEIYLVLQGEPNPPRTIRINGSEVRYLNPDERSTGALVRNALLKDLEGDEVRSSPGIYISKRSFSQVLEDLSKVSRIVYLKEDGQDVRGQDLEGDITFVISDHQDLREEEEALLLAHQPLTVTLGPLSYHADHCITIMLNELDRRQ
ncbi:MAG: tRNA (pseudouridine(54)-N(1))-methyltransferase TrmY [Methanomassiliicoccus sp.]|nr:tRNA (pseudouridine(54)-N(1))-methyltransferase TrmY [Methanomassiliicoccus sp.]